MKIYYRISDKSYEKEKIPGATKQVCLKNCLKSFPKTEIIVIADKCKQETINSIKSIIGKKGKIIETFLGNAQSFVKALNLAIELHDDEVVYMLEDDYIHKEKCIGLLEEGLQFAHYATLFDYIDKYLPPYNNEITKVFRGNNKHWKLSISTTMTFATTAKNLKKDFEIWQYYCKGDHPNDHMAFCTLNNAKKFLAVSIPGSATHTDLTYYNTVGINFPDKWAYQI